MESPIGTNLVRPLDEDVGLGASMAQPEREKARVATVAPLLLVGPGPWQPPSEPRRSGLDLGLLVLDGLLQRKLELAGRTLTELRGPEDLLRPWDDATEFISVRGRVSWTAIEPTRIAWLDGDFAEAAAPWPEIGATIVERGVRRARLLSFRLAIGELRHVHLRVLLLLWHLSDRWGRVRPDGVYLDLPLTHELLAQMVGAHRTSVTVAVKRLTDEARLARGPGGTWILLGGAPDELDAVRHHVAG